MVSAYHPGLDESSVVTEAVQQPLRYMARELDPITGLYYVRNRWYDPVANRFVSEDPIGLAGGINLYAYVGNDPVHFRDPAGLSPETDDCDRGRMLNESLQAYSKRCPLSLPGSSNLDWQFSTPLDQGATGRVRGGYTFTLSAGNPEINRPGGGEAAESEKPKLTCREAVAVTVISAAGDYLTLSGPLAAYRAYRAAGSVATALGRGTLVASGTGAARASAWAAFRGESRKMTLGALQASALAALQDESLWRALPVYGTIARGADAWKICL